jgi:16S rRNA (cytidine1402-2'-O)-methyltransferase
LSSKREMTEPLNPGTLYIVGTPIGNLEDMTFRAVKTLQTVDLIAAEDTRHTGKLLEHFQVKTPQISYYEHNQTQRIPELLDRLRQGTTIALVTDAGMPGISDPGYELVKACIDAEITIVPIPGVSACVTALSVAGIPSDRFVFEGFLPVKGKARSQRLEALQNESRTLILYESPHRIQETLTELAATLGENRPIVVARELTKLHEELWRGHIKGASLHFTKAKALGEFTLIIGGANLEVPSLSDEVLKEELKQIMLQGVSRSQASRQLAQKVAASRRHLYQLALTIVMDKIEIET